MNDKSKVIEQEINNIIEIVLNLNKYKNDLKEKEKKFQLSDNSKEIIKEIIQSTKASKFFCRNEKSKNKKLRNSISIFKEIDSLLDNNNKNKYKNSHRIKKINPISFNQCNLLSNSYYSGTEAELFFIKNIIKNKILNIIKISFEYKFNLNKKELINKKYKNNSLDNRYKFILISSNSLQKAKLRNVYYNSLMNSNNHNLLSTKGSFARNKIINSNNMSIIENSNYRNIQKNNSCINLDIPKLNKNSSMTNDKCTSVNLKNSTIEISKDNKNKYIKKNIMLLKTKKYNDGEKYFMPLFNINDFKYKNEYTRLQSKKLPTFDSGVMELIHYNTKNNIKAKAEKEFLNECLKETYRSLRRINPLYNTKCFVDYSRSNIIKDINEIYGKKNNEAPPKEKKIYDGFEYKNIYKYSFDGNLTRHKKTYSKSHCH